MYTFLESIFANSLSKITIQGRGTVFTPCGFSYPPGAQVLTPGVGELRAVHDFSTRSVGKDLCGPSSLLKFIGSWHADWAGE